MNGEYPLQLILFTFPQHQTSEFTFLWHKSKMITNDSVNVQQSMREPLQHHRELPPESVLPLRAPITK